MTPFLIHHKVPVKIETESHDDVLDRAGGSLVGLAEAHPLDGVATHGGLQQGPFQVRHLTEQHGTPLNFEITIGSGCL